MKDSYYYAAAFFGYSKPINEDKKTNKNSPQ
jgi:hypothetical protein